jgi:hypothetical protein
VAAEGDPEAATVEVPIVGVDQFFDQGLKPVMVEVF